MWIKRFLLLVILSASLTLCEKAFAHEDPLDYRLRVSVDVHSSQINGVASIKLKAGQEVTLQNGALRILDVRLDSKILKIPSQGQVMRISSPRDGTLRITYQGTFTPRRARHDPEFLEHASLVSEHGVSLTGTWYPRPDRLCRYRLTAILPEGFEAISEADVIEKKTSNGKTFFAFHFPYPVDEINLVASKQYKLIKTQFGDVEIFAYFFPEDIGLSGAYVEQTKKYLRLYTDLVGPYPYRRFSIVENVLPTGYSMPTFTLLGQDVVRLPFITDTSLGHEILHQWFGNLVYVDYAKGNWAEGLTAYLADHLYEEQKNAGAAYRKALLIDYRSYVHAEDDVPLVRFRGRTDYASRAIGYGKAAMLFHMLRKSLGDDAFFRSLKYLVETERHSRASWEDVRKAFEKGSGRDLAWYFRQWVEQKGLPELCLENVELRLNDATWETSAVIVQRGKPFILDVPLTLHGKDGKWSRLFRVEAERTRVVMSSEIEPRWIALDEEYDVARKLSRREFPPVIASLLGSDRTLIISSSEGEIYKQVIDTFVLKGAAVKTAAAVTDGELKNADIVLLGADNPVATRLLGKLKSDAGFSLTIRKNPLNPDRVVGIIHADSREEADLAFTKIFHYGRYGHVAFKQGRNVAKNIEAGENGITQNLLLQPSLDQSTLSALRPIIDAIAGKKIIYIGEAHDRFSHHLVQLEVIKQLHQKGHNVAIGMEMFQKAFQPALDEYIAGTIDERQFLKQSQYFKRWGYDYHLYRPILDFARTEKIPVVALNLEEEIVSKVARSGLESLSPEERKKIPAQMDFSDATYKERLKKVFDEHERSKEKPFAFFYEAQLAWDETMAASVDDFSRKHADYQMVVLAGSGHLAYGSGIPKRVARRNGFDYAIILSGAEIKEGMADYVLTPESMAYTPSPRMMVALAEENGKVVVQKFPEGSISEKAGMRVGDTIRSIDGAPIQSIDDLRIELFLRKKGDRLKVDVLRKDTKGGEQEIFFELIL